MVWLRSFDYLRGAEMTQPAGTIIYMAAAAKCLLDGLQRRLPGFDPDPVLNRDGYSTGDELRAQLFRHGATPADVNKIAPRRRHSDNELAAAGLTPAEIVALEPDVTPSRARRIAGLAKPPTGAALHAAVAVVDRAMPIKVAAKTFGVSYNTATWAVRSLRFQRTPATLGS